MTTDINSIVWYPGHGTQFDYSIPNSSLNHPERGESLSMNRVRSITFMLLASAALCAGQALNQTPVQPYRLSDREVENILRSVEKQADTFRQSLRAALNKSHFNGTRREDDINAFVREFDRETSLLRDHFNKHQSTGADVQSVLNRAAEIDRFISRNRLTPQVHNDWNALRSNLEQLAEVYNVTWRWDIPAAVGVPIAGVPFRIDDKEAGRIIRNLERSSDRFRASLAAALDRSRWDGTRREDDINSFVKEFYTETKKLHDHFNEQKSAGPDVQSVLERAARIDQVMQRRPLTARAQNDWGAVKANLDELAGAYGVTWGWSNFASAPVVADAPVEVVITESGSTNSPAYRISLTRGGRAEIATRNRLLTGYVPADLAERFFADLAAAMPLAQLPVGQPCFKSSSFGGSMHLSLGNQRSPDLSCAAGPRAQVLSEDVIAIKRALNLR